MADLISNPVQNNSASLENAPGLCAWVKPTMEKLSLKDALTGTGMACELGTPGAS